MRILAGAVCVAAATWAAWAALWWGTWSAGTADAHGYISQSALWLRGDLIVRQPIAETMPWPDPDQTFAPLGYRPGTEPGTVVPIYPAGLPLVMAAFRALGGPDAVFLVVPLLAALAVLATARVAARLATPGAGALAALLLAASPTFLFSGMWPMSDVPAAAWWILALALALGNGMASAAGAGAAAGLAVLTRPNMVAVALAPALYLAWRAVREGRPEGLPLPGSGSGIDGPSPDGTDEGFAGTGKALGPPASPAPAWRRLALFCALTAAGCLGVAALHTWLYGSPLRTGYGHVTAIFSAAESGTILRGFATRPPAVEPAIVLLGLCGAVAGVRRRGAAGAIAWLCLGTAALVLLSYTFYVWFSDWWYLRLLLPAGPPFAALGGAGAASLAGLVPSRARGLVLSVLAVAIVATGIREAVARDVFALRAAEARYEAVGRFVRDALPPNAALFAFQQSGGLRYYAGRVVVRFDVLLPEWFDTAISKLRSRGYRPYFVVEDHDIREFQLRFRPVSPLGYLDWPPLAELPGPVRVRIFDPADRDRMREGQAIATRRIQP